MEPSTALWTKLIGVALLCGMLGGTGGVWLASHFGLLQMGKPRIVTFDVTKLVNSERAVASGLLGTHKNGNALIVLSKVSGLVRNAIRTEAGPGTIVLVKQGVVSRNVPDITTKVLKKLGLPITKVPTATPMGYATQVAPTEFSQGAGPQAEQQTIDNAWQKSFAIQKQTTKAVNQQALP